jgi:hypothetical protein
MDFEAHIRGIACPVLLMQADRTINGALAQEDLDFFMIHARNGRLVAFPGREIQQHKEPVWNSSKPFTHANRLERFARTLFHAD